MAAAASPAPARTVPTLGRHFAGRQEGFGEVKPATIFLGGDPTGLVTHISWKRWGKPRAIGHGTGWYVPPNRDVAHGFKERARVVAWGLGRCGGHRAYRKLEWYFPGLRRHKGWPATSFDPAYAMSTCG